MVTKKRKAPREIAEIMNNVGIWLGCGFTAIVWYIITNAYARGGIIEITINTYGEAWIEYYMMPFLVILVFFAAINNTRKKKQKLIMEKQKASQNNAQS